MDHYLSWISCFTSSAKNNDQLHCSGCVFSLSCCIWLTRPMLNLRAAEVLKLLCAYTSRWMSKKLTWEVQFFIGILHQWIWSETKNMHKRVHTNAQHTDAVAAILTSRNPNFDNSSGLALWGISTGKLGSHSLDTRRCDGRIGGRHFHVILNTRPVSDSLLKTCFELAIFVLLLEAWTTPCWVITRVLPGTDRGTFVIIAGALANIPRNNSSCYQACQWSQLELSLGTLAKIG